MSRDITSDFTLFDFMDETDKKPLSSKKLDIVQMEFVTALPMTWVELFSGYSKIKAITFSSGITFAYKLLDMFDDAEIIFGCEDVMSNTVQEIMAYQAKLMDKIRRTKDKCIHTIQMYEQGQKKLATAQWNILSALARALHCGVYDLMNLDTVYAYNGQNPMYTSDAFMMQLTQNMMENERRIAQLNAERAKLEAQRRAYSYGYVGQFPVQHLQYNNGYYMPREIFNQNWLSYWNGVVQSQNRANSQEVQKQIAKIGLELIERQAKQNNNKPLVVAANAVGLLHADNLAEAISKVLTIINESR